MTQVLTVFRPLQGLSRSARGCGCARRRCGAPTRARLSGFGLLGLIGAARDRRFGAFDAGAGRREYARPARASADADPPARPGAGASSQSANPRRFGSQSRRAAVRLQGQRRRAQAGARMPRQRGLLRSRQARTTTASARSRRSSSTESAIPAFPASVCGVVYQGSTRPTGCQFTFTCDGSLYRQPDGAGWRAPTGLPRPRLSGSVYAPVGYATHYHADYVRALLGLDPGEECRRRSAHLLPLGGRLGPARRPSPKAMRAVSPMRSRCATPRSPQSTRRRFLAQGQRRRGDQGHTRRRGAQARPVDARRQARRGPLQPRRPQGLERGQPRRLHRRSSTRRTTSNGRFRAKRVAADQKPLGKAAKHRDRRRGRGFSRALIALMALPAPRNGDISVERIRRIGHRFRAPVERGGSGGARASSTWTRMRSSRLSIAR